MSPRGYETLSLAPLAVQRSRRPSGGLPLSYDIASNVSARRPYDSYVPSRAASYRGESSAANSYRPNVYRPGRSYYSRSPSPDRYNRPRSPEMEILDRPTAWKAPNSTTWQDRRPSSPAPTWRRDMMATPMFEPSDTWKETHADRPGRPEIGRSSPAERYPDRRTRDSRNASPGRPARRGGLSPYYRGSDRYRPTSVYRDAIVRSDTYRPRYGEPVPPSGPSFDHRDRRARSPERSITGSISPHSRPRSPEPHSRTYCEPRRHSVTPPVTYANEKFIRSTDTRELDYLELPQNKVKSRSSSRSSIASSRVSQRSPPRNTNSQFPSSYSIASTDASPNPIFPAKPDVVSKESELVSRCSPRLSIKIFPQDQLNNTVSTEIHTTQRPKSPIEVVGEDVSTQSVTIASSGHTKPHALAPRPNEQQQISTPQSLELSPTEPHLSATLPCSCPSTMSPKDKHLKLNEGAVQPQVDPCITGMPHRPSTPLLSSKEKPTDIPMDEDLRFAANGLFGHSTLSSALLVDSETLHSSSLNHRVHVEPSSSAIVDDIPDYIPPMADAKSMAEALRIVVMTRLRYDRQTREERVNPVLLANLSLSQTSPSRLSTSSDALLSEFTKGERLDARMHSFTQIMPSLAKRFAARQAALADKTQRLREEYLTLHERWLAHCSRLDGASKTGTSEEAAPPPGRTTRRSAATLGDAVRSDLEMEQIIASLGNDELTDPNQLSARNVATIPDMVSVECGQVDYLYDDTNNRVDDPCQFYGPHTGIHDWTDKEKAIFIDKFAAFPKQFGIIADHLPNKTVAQCVDYYYLHKKTLIDFRKIVAQLAPTKRRRGTRRASKQKGNGLLADIRQHDDEVHRDSGSSASNGLSTARRRTAMPPPMIERQRSGSRRSTGHLEPTPTSTPTPEPETRSRRRRANPLLRASILAGQDEGEEDGTDTERKPAKKGRKSSRKVKPVAAVSEKQTSTAGEAKFIDQSEFTTRRKITAVNVQWSDVDKTTFLGLLSQYGDDFKRIAASMPNKTTIQVSNFYKCNIVDLDLEKVAAGAPKRSPTPEPPCDVQMSQYPGSGIMSPVTEVLLPDIASPVSPPPGPIPTDSRISTSRRLRGPGGNKRRTRRSPDQLDASQHAPNDEPTLTQETDGYASVSTDKDTFTFASESTRNRHWTIPPAAIPFFPRNISQLLPASTRAPASSRFLPGVSFFTRPDKPDLLKPTSKPAIRNPRA